MKRTFGKHAILFSFALTATLVGGSAPRSIAAAPKILVVPTAYLTIQSAVDAAHAGDRIKILPGTYREQVTIDKDLRIVGSGAQSTKIRAPEVLVAGDDGKNSIVEIHAGASVAMSRLTVSGPGSGTCANGALEAGIRVIGGGHLDLRFAQVLHIHDTPNVHCPRSGTGILVGDFPPGTGSATVRYSKVSDYAHKGILVLSEGAPTTIFRNIVIGGSLSADGIDVFLAAARVSQNLVIGNKCREPDPNCGPDLLNDFQVAGIYAGGPGTVVTRNVLYGNQVGIFGQDSGRISRNFLSNNYFGMEFFDGSFTVSHDIIVGGSGGIGVVAVDADAHATLHGVRIARTSGDPVQLFECCGFHATVSGESRRDRVAIGSARHH